MIWCHSDVWPQDVSSNAHKKPRFSAYAEWQTLDPDERVLKAYSKCTIEIQDKKSKFHLSKCYPSRTLRHWKAELCGSQSPRRHHVDNLNRWIDKFRRPGDFRCDSNSSIEISARRCCFQNLETFGSTQCLVYRIAFERHCRTDSNQ